MAANNGAWILINYLMQTTQDKKFVFRDVNTVNGLFTGNVMPLDIKQVMPELSAIYPSLKDMQEYLYQLFEIVGDDSNGGVWTTCQEFIQFMCDNMDIPMIKIVLNGFIYKYPYLGRSELSIEKNLRFWGPNLLNNVVAYCPSRNVILLPFYDTNLKLDVPHDKSISIWMDDLWTNQAELTFINTLQGILTVAPKMILGSDETPDNLLMHSMGISSRFRFLAKHFKRLGGIYYRSHHLNSNTSFYTYINTLFIIPDDIIERLESITNLDTINVAMINIDGLEFSKDADSVDANGDSAYTIINCLDNREYPIMSNDYEVIKNLSDFINDNGLLVESPILENVCYVEDENGEAMDGGQCVIC